MSIWAATKETGHKLEESKATVITREENNFTKRISEVLKIVWQSPTLKWDCRFELPALHRDVLAQEVVHPSTHGK